MNCYSFWHPCSSTRWFILVSGIHQQRLQFAEDADRQWQTALSAQLLVPEGRWLMHSTAVGWPEAQSTAPVVCFSNMQFSPAKSCPPMKFAEHRDQISLMMNALSLSLAGYQTEVRIQIAFACPCSAATQAERREEEPSLLQQKRKSETSTILMCINRTLGWKIPETQSGMTNPQS